MRTGSSLFRSSDASEQVCSVPFIALVSMYEHQNSRISAVGILIVTTHHRLLTILLPLSFSTSLLYAHSPEGPGGTKVGKGPLDAPA